MPYSHKPTKLGGANPETDRSVWFKGGLIGRVMLTDTNAIDGQWKWTGLWKCDHARNGHEESMKKALKKIKSLHIEDGQPPPDADTSSKVRYGYKWERGKSA